MNEEIEQKEGKEAKAESALISTTQSGEGLGRFALPMNATELVMQLSNGVPCEVPRFWLKAALTIVDHCFSNADISVEADAKIAQLTPHRCELSEFGRRQLEGRVP